MLVGVLTVTVITQGIYRLIHYLQQTFINSRLNTLKCPPGEPDIINRKKLKSIGNKHGKTL